MTQALKLQAATPEHYDSLVALNQKHLPAVSSIDQQWPIKLVDQWKGKILVFTQSSNVAGLIVALDHQSTYPGLYYQHLIQVEDNFAYVDRIVVSQKFQGQGLGRKLYKSLPHYFPELQSVICEINLRPLNQTSLDFHKRLGFQEIGQMEGNDKLVTLQKIPMSAILT